MDRADNWMGPPHNGDMSTKTVQVNADMSCSDGWVSLCHKALKTVSI